MKPMIILVLLVSSLLLFIFGMAWLHHEEAHAAQLTGRYVTLLAVSDDNRVSALDDKLPEQCRTIVERLRALGGFKLLDCVPVDYAKENRKK